MLLLLVLLVSFSWCSWLYKFHWLLKSFSSESLLVVERSFIYEIKQLQLQESRCGSVGELITAQNFYFYK